MLPLKLSVEGLRSFRSVVHIDFTNRHQIAIVGDTGAGKSSILEAITYALYGQTTFSKQPNQELMNALSTSLRVVLRFRVSGQTWVATRTLKRAGNGTVGGAAAELQSVDENDSPLEAVAGVLGVEKRIRSLIGLDGDAFLRTVILPQGNFSRLLIADGQTEKSAVLRQVWRTDELEAAGELARDAATDARGHRMMLEQEARSWPSDPNEHLKELKEERNSARKAADAAQAVQDAADKALGSWKNAQADLSANQVIESQLVDVSFDTIRSRVEALARIAREIQEEESTLQTRQADIESQLEEISSDGDGQEATVVAEVLVKLSMIKTTIKQLEHAADEARRCGRKKREAEAQAVEAKDSASRSEQEAKEHLSRRGPLAETSDKAKLGRRDAEARYDDCEKADMVLKHDQDELDSLQQRYRGLTSHVEQLDSEIGRKRQAAELASQHLDATKQADFAASAAHGLHAGDDCPICAQELPADWQVPANAGIDEAQAGASEADEALRAAKNDLVEARAELRSLDEQLATAEERVEAATADFARALRALAEVAANVKNELPHRQAVLVPLDEEVNEAGTRLKRQDDRQQALDNMCREATIAAERAEVQAENDRKNETDANNHFKSCSSTLSRMSEAVHPDYEPSIQIPLTPLMRARVDTADLDAKIRLAEDRKVELEVMWAKRDALREELEQVATELDELRDCRETDVDQPLAEVAGELGKHRAAINVASGRMGLSLDIPLAAPLTKISAVQTEQTILRSALREVLGKARRRQAVATEQQQAASDELVAIGKKLAVSANDREKIVEKANSNANDAELAKRQAQNALDAFRKVVEDIRRLHDLLAEAEAKERTLNDLRAALSPGAFLKWLTLRRSRSLLSHASVLLKEMSAERYAFADLDQADSPWRVLDNDSGQPRSPASLSGGEQFIASLALALGMVEMMARSGGRLESLFLDEGFGSLDRNNLDAAVEALAMVSTRGRMVGVISHVRAVAEQIDNVLAVTREEAGSKAMWLTEDQRRSMAEDTLANLLD